MSTETRARWAFSFRLRADWARRFPIRSWALAILLVLTLQPTTPARAECDVAGIAKAMQQAVKTTEICKPVCEGDYYRCYAAAALAIVLTEVSRRKGQDKVDSFCSEVQGLLNQAMSNVQLVQEIMTRLQSVADLSDDQISELSTALQELGDVLAVVNCACNTERLQLQNEASFGECANQMLEAIGCGEIDFTTATIGGCDPVGGFIGDVVNEGIDALVDLGCLVKLWDCSPDQSAGPPNTQCIGWGTQADSNGVCHYCSEFGPHVITQADGTCGCEPPYDAIRIGKRLALCQCTPPKMTVDGYCLCPTGSRLNNGVCQPCSDSELYVPFHYEGGVAQMPSCQLCQIGTKASADHLSCVNICNNAAGEILSQATGKCVACPPHDKTVYISGSVGHCEPCEYGQTASADHKSCVPACVPGQFVGGLMLGKDQMADPNAYQCQTCPDNTYAKYEKDGSSRGVCLPCADGTYAHAGATQCLPLNCSPGSYQDPDNPHACKSCPPTQIYIPTEKKIGTAPGGKTSVYVVPGHCGCGENQKLEGDKCVCAADAIKIDLPQAGNSLFACSCPEGSHFDAGKFACICPKGASFNKAAGSDRKCVCAGGATLQNGKCITPIEKKAVPAQPCRPGEVRDDDGVCVKLKPRPMPAPVVPWPGPTRRPPSARDVPKSPAPVRPGRVAPSSPEDRARIVCPPGTVPGPLGKRCIPVRRQ